MDVSYWTNYDGLNEKFTLNVILNTQIELDIVGSQVTTVLGFYDKVHDMWDWLKCTIAYDGDVNTVARFYTVTDSYSMTSDTPNSGLDALKTDKQQDWVIDDVNSQSTCPYLQKCVFQCAASRLFSTEDDNDFDYTSSPQPNVYFGYFVTVEDVLIYSGYKQYAKFEIPLQACSLALSLAAVLASMISF